MVSWRSRRAGETGPSRAYSTRAASIPSWDVPELSPRTRMSAPDGARGQAPGEVALDEHEEDGDGRGDDRRPGHQRAEGGALGGDEVGEPQRQRVLVGAADEEVGDQVLVPGQDHR